MNLRPSHLPRILAGAILGAGLGYLLSCLFKEGTFPTFEQVLGIRQLGLLFGGIAGAAAGVIVLAVKDSFRPETGVPRSFTSINGSGSTFIGRSDTADDGSYRTTEWFTVLWIPVFPVCTYRVIKVPERSSLVSQAFIIKEKLPVGLYDACKGYLRTLAVALPVAFVAWCLSR